MVVNCRHAIILNHFVLGLSFKIKIKRIHKNPTPLYDVAVAHSVENDHIQVMTISFQKHCQGKISDWPSSDRYIFHWFTWPTNHIFPKPVIDVCYRFSRTSRAGLCLSEMNVIDVCYRFSITSLAGLCLSEMNVIDVCYRFSITSLAGLCLSEMNVIDVCYRFSRTSLAGLCLSEMNVIDVCYRFSRTSRAGLCLSVMNVFQCRWCSQPS